MAYEETDIEKKKRAEDSRLFKILANDDRKLFQDNNDGYTNKVGGDLQDIIFTNNYAVSVILPLDIL